MRWRGARGLRLVLGKGSEQRPHPHAFWSVSRASLFNSSAAEGSRNRYAWGFACLWHMLAEGSEQFPCAWTASSQRAGERYGICYQISSSNVTVPVGHAPVHTCGLPRSGEAVTRH
jgi:hypothetical protein